ncbi:hypothetical protein [Arcticibacter sp.]|uniref:hypothetical protein n=1 Tax=Arcticibacter sp. TaxID=1872630 RepID=UPI00388EB47B
MLDKVLDLVKQHVSNNPEIAKLIPPGQEEDVNKEVASGVNEGLKNSFSSGGIGGMLSSLTGGSGNGDMSENIAKAVADRLQGKFGLSPEVIKKISNAIPGIVQQLRG